MFCLIPKFSDILAGKLWVSVTDYAFEETMITEHSSAKNLSKTLRIQLDCDCF
jgi:hypothetical protein